MGMYPICKTGFKTYHTFSIPTGTSGKKKENKKTPIPHYPCSSYNKTLPLPAGPVILYSASENGCSKWPVKKQREPKPKGRGNTETRAFL